MSLYVCAVSFAVQEDIHVSSQFCLVGHPSAICKVVKHSQVLMMSNVPYKTPHITVQQQNQTHFCGIYDKQKVFAHMLNIKNGVCDSNAAPAQVRMSFPEQE